jgi:outer membrane receptor for ferric coprogen and ferric-rhodotorulic acid
MKTIWMVRVGVFGKLLQGRLNICYSFFYILQEMNASHRDETYMQ